MKKMFIVFVILLSLVALFFIIILGYGTIDDYSPDETTTIHSLNSVAPLSDSIELSLMIWNIGYCGLSADMDFFYDGGKKVNPDKQTVHNNLSEIINYLKQNIGFDFFLLQEVDKKSKRSYKVNQYDSIANILSGYEHYFGKNYDVFFIPIPFSNPMGSVESGLMTLSKYMPIEVTRYQYPGNYAWPKKLFMLDRCFLLSRFPLTNGKDLLIINTHNSAYDDGTLRKSQLEYLKVFLTTEYDKGNYIVVGGDWNQCPAEFIPDFSNNLFDKEQLSYIPIDYMPNNWTWAYSNKIPTNRRVYMPYDPKETLTTVIDFYLLSPNIEMLEIKNIDLNFSHSDHQPVTLKIKLRP